MHDPRDMLKAGNLPVTLATWIFLLERRGMRPAHAEIAAACDALSAAGSSDGEVEWGPLGEALVGAVREALADDSEEAVLALARGLWGPAHVSVAAGNSREQRLSEARSYQFNTGLPWMARIYDRFPDGAVGPHWVLVEQITDMVTCMDPYPWDDLEEEYQAPLVDFMVKWELSGCTTLRWVA